MLIEGVGRTDANLRLKEAMAAAGVGGPAELARRAKIAESTARAYVSGGRGITLEVAVRLGAALGVAGQWLFDGTGPKDGGPPLPILRNYSPPRPLFDTRQLMPVYAAAEGGAGTILLPPEPYEYMPRPHTLEHSPDAYAILITGESMFPAFEPGDQAWVDPRLPPMRLADHILYKVSDDGEGRATIKRIVGWTDADWMLQQWNPARTFKAARSEWTKVHRVIGKSARR